MSFSTAHRVRRPCHNARAREKVPISDLLGRRGQRPCDRSGETIAARRLDAESSPARAGEAVVLRAAVVLRRAPFALDEPLVFQAIQGSVERALLDQETTARDLL